MSTQDSPDTLSEATTSTDLPSASFAERTGRKDDMSDHIDEWVDSLAELADDTAASDEFQAWLDTQSKFHTYSFTNTLLIYSQCPEATRVAGYKAWQDQFGRQVQAGESGIWIWAPIITDKCPTCENGPKYHNAAGCDEPTPVSEWNRGVVGFRTIPVYDITQTEGKALPTIETKAVTDDPDRAAELVADLIEAADPLEVELTIVPDDDWHRGGSEGVCYYADNEHPYPRIEVRDRADAAMASTIVHEYAHAILHGKYNDDAETKKREVEAESVAYIVGKHFGLDTSNSSFYLASWAEEPGDLIRERLDRIARTANDIINTIDPEDDDA